MPASSIRQWPSQPGTGAVSITPADSDLAYAVRALYIGTTGNVRITTWAGQDITFPNVPVGFFPMGALRVWSTNTTASGIIGIY